MILRQPGTTVPITLPEQAHLPPEERAVFHFRVLTGAQQAAVVRLRMKIARNDISYNDYVARMLGIGLDSLEGVATDRGGEVAPLDLKRASPEQLDDETTDWLMEVAEELLPYVGNLGTLDDGDRKNC